MCRESLELEALRCSLRAVRISSAGRFPVQLVGQLDLNVSEHVGNGHFEFLGAGGLWKGRRWPCQPQAMLNQSDGSSRQTEVRRYAVSLASTSGGTRHEVGLCFWSPLTGIKTWSVVPSPLLA